MHSHALCTDMHPVVETIFDTFLSAYCNAVNAVALMSEKQDQSQTFEQTMFWMKAKVLADDALKLFREAHQMRRTWTNADALAQEAISKLKER